MKKIEISEDDTALLTVHLSDQEFLYYVDHKDAFRCMWKEQGRHFWVHVVLKFRICMLKHGHLYPFVEMARNGALDYPFIRIAEKMTAKFGDVSELLSDINTVSMNRNLIENMVKPSFASDPFINPSTRMAFRNLFGPPDDKRRILRTYLFSEVFCAWGGALLRVLAQWVDAPKAHPEMLVWTPPACYVDAKADFHPALFERYLKQRWSDGIAKVCGAPSALLVWWPQIQRAGSLDLPPMEEFRVLSSIMEVLMEVLDRRNPVGGATGGVTSKGEKGPPQEPSANGLSLEQALLKLPANKTSKNKKKKEKKKQKAAAEAAAQENKADAEKMTEVQQPNQPLELMGAELKFPEPTALVAEAARDWHEYLPDFICSSNLLKRQLLGGQLFLGWLSYLLKDTMYYLLHLCAAEMSALQGRQEALSSYIVSVRQVIQQHSDVPALRRERDALNERIKGMKMVLSAVLSLRMEGGPQPRAELAEIRLVTQQALASPLLLLYPALYQYSADETPHQQSGQRLAYPDFSRWRHCIRKGVALLAAEPPVTLQACEAAQVAALDWYRELSALPALLEQHLRAQTGDGGTLARRLAERHPDWLATSAIIDLRKPAGGFDMVRWTLTELRRLTADEGPVPRRNAAARPHCSQSLVDLYWARLGAMVFFTDLLALFCCCSTHRDYIQHYKMGDLSNLMDAVLALQVAQCRWLHPRAELELPKRPALEKAADARLWQHHLSVATSHLKRTHQHLQVLYSGFRKCSQPVNAPPPCESDCGTLPSSPCWHLIHYEFDMCGHLCKGCSQSSCDVHESHRADMNARSLLATARVVLTLSVRVHNAEVGAATKWFTDSLPHWLAMQRHRKTGSKADEEAMKKLIQLLEPGEGEWKFRLYDDTSPRRITQVLKSLNLTEDQTSDIDRDLDIWRLEHVEATLRSLLLGVSSHLFHSYKRCAENKEAPDWKACRAFLAETGTMLGLDGEGLSRSDLVALPPLPALTSPTKLYCSGIDWPTVLKRAKDVVGCSNWRLWVVSQSAAESILSRGRAPPDRAIRDFPVCALGSGTTRCNHSPLERLEPDRLLSMLLNTLHDIRFMQAVMIQLGSGRELSVHQSMWNLMTEAYLPYLLALDTVVFETARRVHTELHLVHAMAVSTLYTFLNTTLLNIYMPRPKLGGGRMQRADRSGLLQRQDEVWLRPDVTVCRTISWSQAVDMHMAVMEKIAATLCCTRLMVPPMYDKQGREVHPAPVALLERAEVGAVLLLRAFLPLRDGQQARHLVDVTELPEEVALALDLQPWLQLLFNLTSDWSRKGVQFMHLPPPLELGRVLADALKFYERPLRCGSLLEFLAMRQVHAAPMRWAVRAHEMASRGYPAREWRAMAERARTAPLQIYLPPIHELRSRAQRSSPPSMPAEWTWRLWQLSRVLADQTQQPQLLESVLVKLDYRLDFGCPKAPKFQPSKPPVTEEELTSLDQGDPVALCDYVYQLGAERLRQHADGVMFNYRSRMDHITTGLEHFIHPFCGGPSEALKKAAIGLRRISRLGSDAAANSAGVNEKGDCSSPESDAIFKLTNQLVALLECKDPLSDIPEAPLEPGVLKAARRRVTSLSSELQALPDGDLKWAALGLITVVEQQVKPSKGSRRVTGSAMSVIDLCLGRLAALVEQNSSSPPARVADSTGAKSATTTAATNGKDSVMLKGSETTQTSSPMKKSVSKSASNSAKQVQGSKLAATSETPADQKAEASKARCCSFCERRETPEAPLQLCSLCVNARLPVPRAYCGRPCQTDDWEMGHWQDHQ